MKIQGVEGGDDAARAIAASVWSLLPEGLREIVLSVSVPIVRPDVMKSDRCNFFFFIQCQRQFLIVFEWFDIENGKFLHVVTAAALLKSDFRNQDVDTDEMLMILFGTIMASNRVIKCLVCPVNLKNCVTFVPKQKG